jgi:hypothetical protein
MRRARNKMSPRANGGRLRRRAGDVSPPLTASGGRGPQHPGCSKAAGVLGRPFRWSGERTDRPGCCLFSEQEGKRGCRRMGRMTADLWQWDRGVKQMMVSGDLIENDVRGSRESIGDERPPLTVRYPWSSASIRSIRVSPVAIASAKISSVPIRPSRAHHRVTHVPLSPSGDSRPPLAGNSLAGVLFGRARPIMRCDTWMALLRLATKSRIWIDGSALRQPIASGRAQP